MSSTVPPVPETLPESHVRVLDAAWDIAVEQGIAALTLSAVAKVAGVSRQAVYLFFGNRAGLLTAMTIRKDDRSGVRERFRAIIRTSPTEAAIGDFVRAWFAYLPEIDPVASALIAAGATDPDADDAWRTRMDGVRGLFLLLARRLKDEGRLAAGWTPEAAADFMMTLAGFPTWQALVKTHGWTGEAAAERIVATLLATLVVA